MNSELFPKSNKITNPDYGLIKDFHKNTLQDNIDYEYAPLVSVDVVRSFSKYKSIFRES